MFKKMTVLAMALGVVAAMVLPASASAVWKHGVNPIQQNVQIGLTTHHHQTPNGQFDNGNITFRSNALGGGLQCQTTSAVQFFSKAGENTTGAIDTFDPHPVDETTNCKGEGTLAFCQVHEVEPTDLPWPIHTTGTVATPDIQITHGEIHSEIKGGFCPAGTVTVTAGTLTANPVKTTPYHEHTNGLVQYITVTGTASVNTPAGNDPAAVVQGTFEIEAPNANTYSL